MQFHTTIGKRAKALLLAGVLTFSLVPPLGAFAATEQEPKNSFLKDIGSVQISSEPNEDGGCAEIVKYNAENQKYYVVNGSEKELSIVDLKGLQNSREDNAFLQEKKESIPFSDIESMIQQHDAGFQLGDLTSVAVNGQKDLIAVSVQSVNTTTPGAVVLLDYDGKYQTHFTTGVQPDMVAFTPDGNYILTADEGEPRGGYDQGTEDPKGSVTIVDISEGLENASPKTVTFVDFDDKRQELLEDGVILKKDTDPSVDLEPEYIAVSGGMAYVTLQEANAIAALDIEKGEFTSIRGLGFQDYSEVEVDARKDKKAELNQEPKLRGIYMPDGITAYEADGKTYLLTANEGDSREWPGYINEIELDDDGVHTEKGIDLGETYKELVLLDTADYDGDWDDDTYYLFGGRSFSVWDADTMEQVYDSGSDFEKVTAQKYPDYFNSSNSKVKLDNRSAKKGPEPEYVTVGEVDGVPYAFIGLERIGGVMAYDISDAENAEYVDYLNTRDFSENIKGDVSPEGLDFLPAEESPNGAALLLVGNEVSGTVSMMQAGAASLPVPDEALKLSIISDDHLYDRDVLGGVTEGGALESYLANDRKMIVESEELLDEALKRIAKSDSDYVLVSGDLTKDGEKVNHEKLAEKLKQLEQDTQKQVFVINGNHDISNEDALSYNGTETNPAETIDRADFKKIYADLGYDQALEQDSGSLSYTANLGDDYRLIVIDACIYNNDAANPHQDTAGELHSGQMSWVLAQIKKAIQDGRRPIGMLHHGLVPHTAIQSTFFPQYLLKDYETISHTLADAGLGLVFTGHFHSQDVAVTTTKKGNKLYDMETGSLVTYPSPVRTVALHGDQVTYKSDSVNSLDGLNENIVSSAAIYQAVGGDFSQYAQQYLLKGLTDQVPGMLAYLLMQNGLDQETALTQAKILSDSKPFGNETTLSQFLAACMAKHYSGDEDPGELKAAISALQTSPNALHQMLGKAAWALTNDTTGTLTEPQLDTAADNSGSFTLSSLPADNDHNNDRDDDDDDDSGSSSGSKGASGNKGTSGGKDASSTVSTAPLVGGGTAVTVTTQPDSTVVTAGNARIIASVPDATASILASAAPQSPAQITITPPTASLIQQLRAPEVTGVALDIRVPSAVGNNANSNVQVAISADAGLLNAAREAGKDLEISVLDTATGKTIYSWKFSGADLAQTDFAVTRGLNLAMTVQSVSQVASVHSVVPSGNGVVLRFANNGQLPAPATVRVDLSSFGYQPGQILYFYHWNPATGRLEPAGREPVMVDAQSYGSVTVTHNSDFVLLPEKLSTGSLTLDTRSYTLPVGRAYEIGVKLTGEGSTLKVVPSRSGIVKVEALKNGNYKITGLKNGTAFISFDVYAGSKLLTHASVKVSVQSGGKAQGISGKQTAVF